MNPRTLEALRASIEKWERNAGMTDPDAMRTSIGDCPLCALFYGPAIVCSGCPVYARTGLPACRETPYYEVIDEEAGKHRRIAAAQAEVEFLRSLLPEDEA